MAPSRTSTVKNKHAAAKSGIANSKAARRPPSDGIVKSSAKKSKNTGSLPNKQVKDKGRDALIKKLRNPKKRSYTEEELGIPKLNTITPVGVIKPKGKKKGKVFVDDRESMNTILSLVQAEKNGQIESKMIKARQMEEIREARKVEAEKKEFERESKIETFKDALRKRRKRKTTDDAKDSVKDVSITGTKAGKAKGKKRVSFA
ncbi:60S ribosomal subunit assembly/export protein [Neonectria magnoliae]|uniref:60S ribosomal subunit assembly/export protein n=2 Tax=Neonectria TaxID=140106 RepID=A0ABR1GVR9_9HYPO